MISATNRLAHLLDSTLPRNEIAKRVNADLMPARLFAQPGRGRQGVLDAISFDVAQSEEEQLKYCIPLGKGIDPQVACVSPMMVHHDETEAIRRG